MDDYQISGRRITAAFNERAAMTMPEKVELLRASLPQEKQQGLADLRHHFAKDTERLQQRQEKERPLHMEKAYNAEHARVMQSIVNSKMPPPPVKVIEQNALSAAKQHVLQTEAKSLQRLQQRHLEQEYDFLKRSQPDHPIFRQQKATEQVRAKDRFNEAARKPDGGRSL